MTQNDLKICRICCENEADYYIFDSKCGVDYRTKILYCCKSLNIEENDGLPSKICSTCELELEASYKFVLKCEESDKQLRSNSENVDTVFKVKIEEFNRSDDDGDIDDHPLVYFKDIHYKTENKVINTCNNEVFHIDKTEPSDLNTDPCLKSITNHTKESNLIISKYKKRKYKQRIKTKLEDLICSICNKQLVSLSALTAHLKSHSTTRPCQCSLCDKSYKDKWALRKHIERCHLDKREKKFICEKCGKGFYSKCDITNHMRTHTGETPYSCNVCQRRFTQSTALKRHMARHTDHKTQMCATCGKSFWTKEELQKHLIVHNDIRNFTCTICNFKFKHKQNLQKHMNIHCEPKKFVCNYCGQSFNGKGNLKTHIDRRHSEKSGFCTICSKNVSNIEVHMWKHNGQRPLKCEYCTSCFSEHKALALHVNFKHKKTDKHKCTVEGCSETFPSKPMLSYHVARYHNMETVYPCSKCSRGFYRKNDLSRHMIGTHKEKLLSNAFPPELISEVAENVK